MVLIITFIVTMIVGVPICYVLGLVGAAGLVSMGPTYFSTVAQKLFASSNNYSLMAIPMFILAGELMGLSGDVHRLMDFCRSIIGRIRGGIAYVCTIVGLLLGGILGNDFLCALAGIVVEPCNATGSFVFVQRFE